MSLTRKALAFLSELFDADDDPNEPFYDPVHLAGVLVVVMAAAGALYWLLWTLLVYEGGIFLKLSALNKLVFGGKSLKDLGYNGSFDPGAFRGWAGNLGALVLCVLVLAALYRTYHRMRRRAERK